MSTHTFQIGKSRFICGLFWQSLSRPRDFWKEAAKLSYKIDADLMVLRKDHATAQAGYGHTRDGAKRGLYSLAAIISKTLAIEGAHYDGHQQPVHNWLCAFKLPDGMWSYCAVRDANFLPNGDFAGTRDEVLERLQGDYALGGWNVVIGEPELEQYGFHNFSGKTLDDLLPKRKNGQLHLRKWSALLPVKNTMTTAQLAVLAGAAFLLVVAGAGYLYQQHLKKEREREQALEAARARLAADRTLQSPQRPWLKKPLPLVFARACEALLQPVTPGGWQLDQYVCEIDHVTYNWSGKDSSVRYLHEKIPTATIDINGKKARDSVPLQLKADGKDIPIPADVVLRQLLERSQSLGIELKLTATPPPPAAAPVNGGAAALPKPEATTYALAAELGVLAPTQVAEMINQPGVRLDRITWSAGNWSIEGVVYAK